MEKKKELPDRNILFFASIINFSENLIKVEFLQALN